MQKKKVLLLVLLGFGISMELVLGLYLLNRSAARFPGGRSQTARQTLVNTIVVNLKSNKNPVASDGYPAAGQTVDILPTDESFPPDGDLAIGAGIDPAMPTDPALELAGVPTGSAGIPDPLTNGQSFDAPGYPVPDFGSPPVDNGAPVTNDGGDPFSHSIPGFDDQLPPDLAATEAAQTAAAPAQPTLTTAAQVTPVPTKAATAAPTAGATAIVKQPTQPANGAAGPTATPTNPPPAAATPTQPPAGPTAVTPRASLTPGPAVTATGVTPAATLSGNDGSTGATATPSVTVTAGTTAPTGTPVPPTPAAPPALVSVPAAAPKLDGQADDAAWASAPAVVIGAKQPVPVIVRSVYDQDRVYFLVTWADPSASLLRAPWQKQADGSWSRTSGPEFTADQLAVAWVGSGSLTDLWQWNAARRPGQLDDLALDSAQVSQSNPTGLRADPGTGGDSDNVSRNGKAPAFMTPGGGDKSGAPGYIADEAKEALNSDLFKTGERVPSVISAVLTGDRGDVSAAWHYASGGWTLEISRKRVTGSASDIQFDDLAKTFTFYLSTIANTPTQLQFKH